MMHGRLFSGLQALAALGMALCAGLLHAQNAIESLNVSQQGASVVLKINLKTEPANPPAGFVVNNPPRVALDFPNTVNALGRMAVYQGGLIAWDGLARGVVHLDDPFTAAKFEAQ